MLAKVLTDRWCKLKVFFWTNIILAIFSGAFYFFDPKATMMIMVLYFLLNILHQIPSPLHWSLMADVDDYGEWKTGLRIEGILFSAGTLGQTLGMGLGSASVGWMLGAAGFVSGGNAVQSPQVVSMIEFLFIAFPFGLALINMAIMYFYRLDTLYEQVEADLSQGKLAE